MSSAPAVASLSCPQCGAAIELRTLDQAQSVYVTRVSKLAGIRIQGALFDRTVAARERVLTYLRAIIRQNKVAMKALAIHHEHRARDLQSARHYASVLNGAVSGRARMEVDRRMRRIDRKLDQRESDRNRTLRYE